jgi:predicted transcriptional regulator
MGHGVEALTAEDWKFLPAAEAGPMTRFEAYLRQHEIKPAHLAQRSGYTRQHLHRLRHGTQEPTRRCITAIVVALRSLTGDRVEARDLFDLGEG